MVLVDRLSKYAHFSALPTDFNVVKVAEIFLKDVIKLHGIPTSIVSDRERIFTSKFWKELHRLSGTKLSFSSSCHPEIDGQIEVMNRTLEMYLRSCCYEDPKQWLGLLPWAELWYNSRYHSSLGMTPFKAVYGKEADELPHYNAGESQIESVDTLLQIREEVLEIIKKNLAKAQARMKSQADRKKV